MTRKHKAFCFQLFLFSVSWLSFSSGLDSSLGYATYWLSIYFYHFSPFAIFKMGPFILSFSIFFMTVTCFKWYCKFSLVVFTYPTYHPLIFPMGKNIYFVILWIVLKKLLMTGAGSWHLIPKADGAGCHVLPMSPGSLSFPAVPHHFQLSAPPFPHLRGSARVPRVEQRWGCQVRGERAGPVDSVLCACYYQIPFLNVYWAPPVLYLLLLQGLKLSEVAQGDSNENPRMER